MSRTRSSSSPRSLRPLWFWVAAAFFLLIAAWTALIIIAQTHKPEVIDLPTAEP